MRKLGSLLATALIVAPLAIAIGARPAAALSVAPLVTVPSLTTNGLHDTANGINAEGQVVGTSADDADNGRPQGFLVDATNTTVTTLGSLGGIFAETDASAALALNDHGTTVGNSSGPVGGGGTAPQVAVAWDEAGHIVDLGTFTGPACTFPQQMLGPCPFSIAQAINNSGTVVGNSDLLDAQFNRTHHAFVDQLSNLAMSDLGTLTGGHNSNANGVNDADLVVGDSETANGTGGIVTHAFVEPLSTHQMTDIGTLPGGTTSSATAVNRAGVVVGTSTVTGGANHPFSYDSATHTMTDLGLPPGATHAEATALDNMGLVVGNSDAGPWVYDQATKTFAIIAGAMTATGVNDAGEIVGTRVTGESPFPGSPFVAPYRTSVRTSVPNAPTDLHITTTCGSAPHLKWTASAPKRFAGIDAYVVFRNDVMVGKVTGTAFTDSSAPAPATYQVVAQNTEGLSAPSNSVVWSCAPGLTGTVTSGGAPAGGVDVRVYQAGVSTFVAKAQTDVTGHYGVPVLAPGSYNVRFNNAAGTVVLAWNGGAPTQAAAAPVIVTAGMTTTVDADLVGAGLIAGRANLGVTVRVYPLGSQTAIAKTVVTSNEDNVDVYSFGGLRSGSYQLLFEDPNGNLVTTWNGGGPLRSGAPPVVVTVGATTMVDVTMPLAGTISGTLTSTAAGAAAGVMVRVYLPDTGTTVATAISGADGIYHVAAVAEGDYQVRFSAKDEPFAIQWAHGAADQGHADTITVGFREDVTLDATLTPSP